MGVPGYSSLVTCFTDDALALDNGLQVSDTRVLREVAEGFSLEFGRVLLGAFNSGQDGGVESSRERRHGHRIGQEGSHEIDYCFWDLAECACACLVFVCRLRIKMISGGKLAMLYFATAPPACPQVVFSERDGAGSRGAHGGNEPVMPHVPLPYHRVKNRELLPAPGHIGPRRVGRRPFVCYARLHGVYAR